MFVFVDAEMIRLVGGKNSSEGRIEVKHNGIWGNICTQNFSLTEAVVVCRSLGYMTRYTMKSFMILYMAFYNDNSFK